MQYLERYNNQQSSFKGDITPANFNNLTIVNIGDIYRFDSQGILTGNIVVKENNHAIITSEIIANKITYLNFDIMNNQLSNTVTLEDMEDMKNLQFENTRETLTNILIDRVILPEGWNTITSNEIRNRNLETYLGVLDDFWNFDQSTRVFQDVDLVGMHPNKPNNKIDGESNIKDKVIKLGKRKVKFLNEN